MVCEKGQRFTLRHGLTAVGTGVITNLLAQLTEIEKTLLQEGKRGLEKLKNKQQQ